MDGRRAGIQFVLAVVVLLGVAAVVRVPPITAGVPYVSYLDEGHVLRPAAHMLAHHSRDPGEYQYPPLLISSVAISTVVYDAVQSDDMVARARQVEGTEYYDNIEPTDMILIGRLITLAFSLGTVLLTVLVGARLVGRFGGLLAGLVAAFTPALVQRSAITIVDTPATFFVMATLFVCLKLDTPRRPLLWAGVAGATVAGAFLSKYPSGAVVLTVVVVLLLQRDRPWRTRLAQGAITVVTAVAVSLLMMPALYLKRQEVIDQIQAAADKYNARATEQTYLEQFLLNREVGWLMAAIAVVGLIFLLRSPRSRALTIGWLTFAVVLVGSLLWTSFQPFRNVLPVVPYLGIAVVAAILPFARWVARTVGASRGVMRTVALTLTVALCFTMLLWGVLPVTRAMAVVDSRREAREWVQRTADENDRTVVAEELAFLPSELDRFPGPVTVLPAAEIAQRDPSEFDIALWGSFTDELFLPEEWEQVQEFGREPTPAASNSHAAATS